MRKKIFNTTLLCLGLMVTTSCVLSQPDQNLEKGMYAKFTTSKGEILVELFYEQTPMTVANFVGLAEGSIKNSAKEEGEPYYDGLSFHRVINDFMVQGGDPAGTGSGGPGYKFPDEIVEDLKHDAAGTLSMANAGPGTNGSQFFITHNATPWLDGKHTVFGKVKEGLDVVNAIVQGDIMEKVEIVRVGSDAEKFEAASTFESMQGDAVANQKKVVQEKTAGFTKKVMAENENVQVFESGLMIVTLEEGTGSKPASGQSVSLNYQGRFEDGKLFDTNIEEVAKKEGVYDPNRPYQTFTFPLGAGRVIKGWDEGIAQLKVGEKAKLFIPFSLAYGAQGYPGAIPPYSNLVFEVELISAE